MGESQQDKTTVPTTERSMTHAVLVLATTALDTTWRTLVPGIVGTVGGLILDHLWHTTPVIMIVGLVLGIGLSALLITQQFKGLKK